MCLKQAVLKSGFKLWTPEIGNKIYDGVVGSAGFLVEAIEYLKESKKSSTAESENSWTVNIKDIDQNTFDISAKNPNTPEEVPLRQQKEILNEIKALD